VYATQGAALSQSRNIFAQGINMTDNEKMHKEAMEKIIVLRAEQGWNDHSMLTLAMQFITETMNGDLLPGFAKKLEEQQKEENGG
jgi:hypothetical protein